VPRFLEAAVLVSEDGRFWSHRGFDQRAIESSIRQNVEAGRFMRGASTISMQLAKNLYLTREKTVTRKIQEALLTMLLEQGLRKDEILELYFNVVELAPGIYGVGPGAEHYFATVPADLSVAQSFFLASVLPSPSSQRFDDEGRLKPNWRNYIDRLMRIAAERDRITQAELERGLEEEVRFGVPASDPWALPESGAEPNIDDLIPF
jgi:membrane peptidoglycan carboxypeptidase